MPRKQRPPQDNARTNTFLDELIRFNHIKNDAAFGRVVGWAPPLISKIRNNHRIGLSAQQIIDVHLKFGVPVRDIIVAVNPVNQE